MIGVWEKHVKIRNGYVIVCGSMKSMASRIAGMIGNVFGKKFKLYVLKTGEKCINKKCSGYLCEGHCCCE